MKVFRDLEQTARLPRRAIATVGNFDGVHIGHQRVINSVVNEARAGGRPSLLVTFHPNPRNFFNPESPVRMITTEPQRQRLLEDLGVQNLVILPFDDKLASMSPVDFVKRIIVDNLGVSELIVSSKFRFGARAHGNVQLLEQLAGQHSVGFRLVENVYFRHTLVSSSFVRQVVGSGEMDIATSILGRPYRIEGEVVHDSQRASKLLKYPTCNIVPVNELIPVTGIYASAAEFKTEKHIAATYIGKRPTFGGHRLVIESHILDFNGDLYGKNVSIEFLRKIRDDQTFSSPEELRRQIGRDIEEILSFFRRHDGEASLPQVT